MKILIAGGTGLVGKVLTDKLKKSGNQICILSRQPDISKNTFYWNPDKMEIDAAALEGVDVLINLAGAGIANQRWTKNYKKKIVESRINANKLFVEKIKKGFQPKQYISAAAIGIYGDRANEALRENSKFGNDFLAEVCILWEQAIQSVANLGVLSTWFRIGIVLSKNGGALSKMLPSYNFGIGSYFGTGNQWYSWIHIDDIADMILHAIDQKLQGSYNAVSPNPVTNKEFAHLISQAKNSRHLVIPVPKFLLKTGMGEMSAIVLNSTRVSSKKIEDTGFKFQYPLLLKALKEIV